MWLFRIVDTRYTDFNIFTKNLLSSDMDEVRTGHFWIWMDNNGDPVLGTCWWTDKRDLVRFRRQSIKLSITYLRKNVWNRRIGSRWLGGISRKYAQGLQWDRLSHGDEVYLRHSVQYWRKALRREACAYVFNRYKLPAELFSLCIPFSISKNSLD